MYDENNNTYKVKSYTYDELVADDIRSINEYNGQLHPNQKKYPGMTRWDVLLRPSEPEPRPRDKAVLYRYIGFRTDTTIRNNSYLTVQYNNFVLPDPETIARLEPRNYKVEAYYLPDGDGNIGEVYIYQHGRYIATCKPPRGAPPRAPPPRPPPPPGAPPPPTGEIGAKVRQGGGGGEGREGRHNEESGGKGDCGHQG